MCIYYICSYIRKKSKLDCAPVVILSPTFAPSTITLSLSLFLPICIYSPRDVQQSWHILDTQTAACLRAFGTLDGIWHFYLLFWLTFWANSRSLLTSLRSKNEGALAKYVLCDVFYSDKYSNLCSLVWQVLLRNRAIWRNDECSSDLTELNVRQWSPPSYIWFKSASAHRVVLSNRNVVIAAHCSS